jgi:isoquinoline 1-oxidoreductase
MSDDSTTRNLILEPERYELAAPPAYSFELERREFFRILGAGIVVVSVARGVDAQQESGGGRRGGGERASREISAWLHIGEDGTVTANTGKVEIGQNIRTSLSQAVAEELHLPLASIRMVLGDTDVVPFDAGTFGSQSTPVMNLQLRKVASAACELLLGLAAETWKVDAKTLRAADGKILDAQGQRSISYAALVKGKQLTQQIPAEDPLIPAAEWTVAGQPIHKVDGRDYVTGRHRYPSDQTLPAMLHGKVLRAPALGAALVSADVSAAQKMPGVTVVRDSSFIAVAAPGEEQASRAISAIRAEWKFEPQPSSKEIFQYLKSNPEDSRGSGFERGGRNETGSIEKGMAEAEQRLQQTYTVAYIAHIPLEPRAALANWEGEKLTVWTGTQRPFGVRGELAQAFRIPESRVRVLMPAMGSGYGGKHTGEAAIEAARLARAAGKPVKIIWTREEEFTWAYARPAGVIEVKSGVRADGTVTAWEFHNYNSGSSAIRPMYAFANQRIEFHRTRSPLRQGSYRGLAATANHFAREVHMDELAHAVKMDPLAFRLKNLKDERLIAVLQAAAREFGWGQEKSARDQGFGMAGGFEKGSYVASCAEVVADKATGAVRVVRVVTSFECGAIVNPDGLRNQVEGSVIMGLGGALFESLEFENGKMLNPRLSDYRVPRFKDVPALKTVLLDRKDLPSEGAGETPIVAVAPAIANAIFDATGTRLRSMPLIPNGLRSA